MKRLLLPLLMSLALAACVTVNPNEKSVLQGGTSVTASISNPVGARELALVEQGYLLAGNAVKGFAAYCYPASGIRPPGCAQRGPIMRAIKSADRKAYAAIVAARAFVRNNPNVSAVSAVGAARSAVNDFIAALQNAQAQTGAPLS